MSPRVADHDGAAGVACETCVAACCRAGSTVMLTSIELQKHRRAMKLRQLVKERTFRQEVAVTADELDDAGNHRAVETTLSVPPHHGLYVFLTDCGNLEERGADGGENRRCTVYDQRPTACRNFEPGSPACISARARFGLDGHEPTQTLHRDEPLRIRGL
jgi:Fe-S-cluster containining protein